MNSGFVEPVYVPDVFVTDIAYMEEFASGFFRIAFYDARIQPNDMCRHRIVVAKFLMTREGILAAMKKAQREAGIRGVLV